MSSATIKLFLVHGDARRLRTGELSNWTGKALAAPRTEIDELLDREEAHKSGVYFLLGTDPITGNPQAYIGEAEDIAFRLKQHKAKEFWVSVIVFVSKDENLTKAHIRYLEGRLIDEASRAQRYTLSNAQSSGARLPESDRHDMEAFLERMSQLLPVLGTDILVLIAKPAKPPTPREVLTCKNKDASATGQLIETGFVVFKGSTSVLDERASAASSHPFVVKLRTKLQEEGTLVPQGAVFVFTRDYEFSSPSAAAAVIQGGGANGLTSWRYPDGATINERDEQ